MEEPFYIGYHEKAPAPHRRAVRVGVGVMAGLLLLSVTLLVQAQRFDESRFEFGNVQTFEGRFRADPSPHLVTPSGEAHLLVGQGKHAASVAAEPGAYVRLSATRIIRGQDVMLEVVPGSESVTGATEPLAAPRRGGSVSLAGEVVGSKCFLGVMNPAHGAVHSACASHCILGGVPALLHTGDSWVLLTGLDRREMAGLAGRPVRIEGISWELPYISWVEVTGATPMGIE